MISDEALQLCAATEKAVGMGATPLALQLAMMSAMEAAPKDEDHKRALFWESRLFGLHFAHTFPTSKRHPVEAIFPDFKYISPQFNAGADEYFKLRIEK